ncbi:MAG TPA: dTDP-4-dehydrorhamnose 3,5-epimerase family protein [Thermoanaerobaculia bacterium]|nr:dTDP-4-dehydrorhamnose 3,5-epimerase family protein [Thermoanaerobaculia bacterium]
MNSGNSPLRGVEHVSRKRSEVDREGALQVDPIDGVAFRMTRAVPHEDGHLTEILKSTWEIAGEPIVQVQATTTFPGRIRAWGLHRHNVDRLFVASGLLRIVCYDGREGSPTFGRVNAFTVSEKNPGLLRIPPDIYHGWKNIGVTEAIVINLPTTLYDYDRPDSFDLPWDGEAARRLIPYSW